MITGTTGFDASQVKYTSSNSGIATVDRNGKVTAKAVGKTKITVEATDGSKKKATMYVGKGKFIEYGTLVYDEYGNPTNKNVRWSVGDSNPVDKCDSVNVFKSGNIYRKSNIVEWL